jgi:hypothetical protein
LISFIKNYYFYIFILIAFLLFTIGYDYAYPIEANPDEVGQLKNIYGMIQSKSLSLQYFSSYSVWTHYIYIIPVLIYWGVFYIFSDLQSMADLQYYILNNYYQVVPFLRIFTALLFLISLIYIREVLKNTLNIVQANLFFIFISLNLLIVINAHYAKHWMVDIALIFFSLYFYYKYNLNRKKLKYVIFSFFLFSFGVLSSYPLILSGIYFLLIYFYFNKGYKLLLEDITIYILVFGLMILYTINMGFGGLVEEFELIFDSNRLHKIFSFTLDYDPIVTTLFILSLFFLIYTKNLKILFVLIPYLGYLIFLSFFDAQPRYALFLVIDAAFLATFFVNFIFHKNKKIFFALSVIYIIFNLLMVVNWLNIIQKEDTRVEARKWIETNITRKDFIIYNTFGFNYLPLTKESIEVMQDIIPNVIGAREKLHLKYNLKDDTNGIILWKIDQSKEYSKNIVKIIQKIINKGYRIVIINEKFGKIAKFSQPSKYTFQKIRSNFNLKVIQKFMPYRNSPNDVEQIGDIILNFENVLQTMFYLKQSGPVITIYEINEDKHARI